MRTHQLIAASAVALLLTGCAAQGQDAPQSSAHGAHAQSFEDLRKGPLHDAAVFENVGNSRGTAQVVLQDVHLAVAIAHQIGACDVAPDFLRRIEPDAFFSKRPRRLD